MPQMDCTTFFFYIEYSFAAFVVLNIILFAMHKVAIFDKINLFLSRNSISKISSSRCVYLLLCNNIANFNAA